MIETNLKELPPPLKKLVLAFTLVLGVGFITGLIYLYTTSGARPSTVIERYNGSSASAGDEFAIPENYPKPLGELLITTHGHIIQFALIYFLVGGLFYFNSRIRGGWCTFLMVEPMVSTLVTFGGIWVMRFIWPEMAYVVMASSLLMYVCFFVMVSVILADVVS